MLRAFARAGKTMPFARRTRRRHAKDCKARLLAQIMILHENEGHGKAPQGKVLHGLFVWGPATMIRVCAFIASLALCVVTFDAASAADFTVNSTLDAVDVNPGDGLCQTAMGHCTLRAAIGEANQLPGLDRIILPAGTYTISLAGTEEDANATGDLDVTDHLIVTGAGSATTTIDGADLDRILHVDPGGAGISVGISGVTITNAAVPQSSDLNLVVGAGIANNGTLMLRDVVVTGNEAKFFLGTGAGIHNTGSLTAVETSVINNTGIFNGGVYNSGSLVMRNGQISNNTGSGSLSGGGGLRNDPTGTAVLRHTTVAGNTARSGGGIRNSGTLTVKDSAIVNNNADFTLGGGVYNLLLATFENSTISGNTAGDFGGGVYNTNVASFVHSTIAFNDALAVPMSVSDGDGGGIYNTGAVAIETSIVSSNRAYDSGSMMLVSNNCHPGSNFSSFGYNLESADDCGFSDMSDLTSTDPLLGSLADNGGLTLTHALTAGSPAIDGGPAACTDSLIDPLPTDQRGYTRPVDGDANMSVLCDIGPFEKDGVGGSNLFVTGIVLSNSTIAPGQTFAYELVVANAGPLDATGVTLTNQLPAGVNFVSATPSQGAACNESGGTVTCALGALTSGASAEVIVYASASTEGVKTNSASVDGDQDDPDSSDDTLDLVRTVSYPDTDGDGIKDNIDNCPAQVNPGQEDNDGDGTGDVCDSDDDNDGVLDAADNCPINANANQLDSDGDTVGDACDPDDDNDGMLDAADNCPVTGNPTQANTDGDSMGDACDADDDNDGMPDTYELANGFNPLDPSDGSGDADGDGFSNLAEYRGRSNPLDPNSLPRMQMGPILELLLGD